VTGAASGIGAATARLLARRGHRVGCLDADGPAVQRLAVEALTRDCALAWAARGIRVNAIAPGVIETPMSAVPLSNPDVHRSVLAHIPMQRLGRAEEIAGVCESLLSDAASYVTGAVIPADGGYGIV
jgi:NAD(P)-dependent dehydrogenase (short-subunit alcohol dehydrogenase family)